MPEITLRLDDPAEFARWAKAHASQIPATWADRAWQLQDFARQIEEQVKPAIEEPTERWSVIRARPGWKDADLREFTLLSGGYWVDSNGNECGAFGSFSDVEVLRVGVGDTSAYAKGATDTATRIQIRLRALAAEAITAEQQNAFMKAFEAVGEEA